MMSMENRNMPSATPQMGFKDYEYHGWERSVEQYHASFSKLTTQTTDAILSALAVGSDTKLLDVASGPGYIARRALALGASAIAVDFSDSMVEKAKAIFPQLDIRKGDAENLDFDDGSCNAVAMNFGLLHLGAPEEALSECARVLVPAGRFAFTVWATPNEAVGFGIVLKAVEQYGEPNISIPKGPPFFKYSDPELSKAALLEAGFHDIAAQKLPLVWELSSPGEFFDAYYLGTPRTGGLLRAQSPAYLAAVRKAVEETVASQYGHSSGVRLPMPAWLYTAVK